MITDEKIKKVQKQLRNGIPQGELHNDLLKEGYTEDDIKKVFVPHTPDMRSWYLLFSIVFLIVGVYFFSLILVAGAASLYSLYYTQNKKAQNNQSNNEQ